MNAAKHSYNTERTPSREARATPRKSPAGNESIIPDYMRSRVMLALGQRVVHDAIRHRSIDLQTHIPQETIFTDFNNLEQTPQTD